MVSILKTLQIFSEKIFILKLNAIAFWWLMGYNKGKQCQMVSIGA